MRAHVHREGPEVLRLLRQGSTAAEVAAATGVKVDTIRSWIRRYPAFGAAAHPRAVRPAGDIDGLPDRRELLLLLADQARGGSLRAVELLLRETPVNGSAAVDDDEHWRRLMVAEAS